MLIPASLTPVPLGLLAILATTEPRSMRSLEELHRALVLFCRLAGAECPQVSALTRLGIRFPGIQTVFSAFEFFDHALRESL